MGWQQVSLEVSASVSRHNSEKDARDDALWQDFVDRATELALDPKYEPLQMLVT